MNTERRDRSIWDEIKELVKFLGSLWGILGGISIFFPFSNDLSQLIPLSSEVIFSISPALITVIASIFTVFIVLDTFVGRFDLINKAAGPKFFRLAARHWLWISLIMLAALFGLYYFNPKRIWECLHISLVTGAITVLMVLIVLDTIGRHLNIRNNTDGSEPLRFAAWGWLWIGGIMLVAYLILYAFKGENIWDCLQVTSGDPRQTFYDISLMILYSGFFASLTKAFMLLGMIEFYRRENMRSEHSDLDL